ncbi:metal-dependent hydrolase [Haloprofundus sp. MHR1]|uniref:metal-dependent hydrolase n=1 Tax=Haloprofundus sp. MHR1 TaxID=2572921 RepID=UPI0010BE1D4E|nr:metal-dependent hydrolase [Haloprofundus sp. MHR1]QCJ45841.1 metal-dependent hydrolase [Haloprofundus sp. MHR1]
MLPWGHAALGYLLYSYGLRLRRTGPPSGLAATCALAVGTQFPDLVDKPLSWTFKVLPGGRTLAHTLFVAVPLLLAVAFVARRFDRRRVGDAFVVGYASHLLGDVLWQLGQGNVRVLAFLVWPLIPVDEPEYDYSIVEFFLQLELTAGVAFGLVVTVVGLLRWWRDGAPPLPSLGLEVAHTAEKSSGERE